MFTSIISRTKVIARCQGDSYSTKSVHMESAINPHIIADKTHASPASSVQHTPAQVVTYIAHEDRCQERGVPYQAWKYTKKVVLRRHTAAGVAEQPYHYMPHCLRAKATTKSTPLQNSTGIAERKEMENEHDLAML